MEKHLHYNEQELSKPSVNNKYAEKSNLMAAVESVITSTANCSFFLRFFPYLFFN